MVLLGLGLTEAGCLGNTGMPDSEAGDIGPGVELECTLALLFMGGDISESASSDFLFNVPAEAANISCLTVRSRGAVSSLCVELVAAPPV